MLGALRHTCVWMSRNPLYGHGERLGRGRQPPLLRPATGVPTTTSLQRSDVGSNESVRARPAGGPWRIGSGGGGFGFCGGGGGEGGGRPALGLEEGGGARG